MYLDRVVRNVTPFMNIILAVEVKILCRTKKPFGMCGKIVSTVSGLHLAVFPHTPGKPGPNIASNLNTSLMVTGQSLKFLCFTIYLKPLSVGCPIVPLIP